MKSSLFKGALALLLLAAAGIANATGVAQVTHLSGTLVAKRADGTTKLLSVKSEVQQGDMLTTQDDTYARIKFVDGAEVVMRPTSELKIEQYSYNESKPESDNAVLSMFKGGLRAVTGILGKRNKDKVAYNTPTATIGIRGTHFGALFCLPGACNNVPTASGKPPENGLHLDVADGAILVKNSAGQQILNAGQFGFVKDASTPPTVVPPQQGIQVTMPSSIAQNKGSGQGIGKSKESECVAQ